MEVAELEDLLDPEDVDVDFRRILKEARDGNIFETFSSDGLSDFLVAEWSRWDKYKRTPWKHDSLASASEGWWREDQEQPIVGWGSIEKGVMDAVEDDLENWAQVKVDIEVVESLLKPEKTRGFAKVHPEALNEKREQYFPALRHVREAEPLW